MVQTIPYRYTETEQKKILSSLQVLIDTRERGNVHIIRYLQEKKVSFKEKKLDYGDYSFFLPADPEMGIMRDIYFNNHLAVERKADLDELAGNLTRERQRFEAELIRATGCSFFLLVENGSIEQVLAGSYRSAYNPKSFMATLITFQHRYGMNLAFVESKNAGIYMLGLFHYYLREWLK